MPQQQGGASSQDSGDEAQGREQAAAIAAQRAAADAAIAAVAGGRQALAAMTTASAAAARAAGTVEGKREAELAALAAEEAAAQVAPVAEVTAPRQPAADRGPRAEAPAEDEIEAAAAAGAGTEAEFTVEERAEPESRPEPEPASAGAAATAAPPSVPEPAARVRRAAPRPVRDDGPLPALGEDPVSRWLAAENAPDSFRRALYAEFGTGDEAAELLAGNPWLVLELPAVQPALVDRLAAALLGGADARALAADPRRSRALVGWQLRRAALAGHTAVPADEMTRALAPQVPDPAGAIADAVEQGAVLIFADRLALPPAQDGGQAEAEEAEFEAVDAADDDDPVSMLTSPYTLLALDRWAFLEQSAAEAVQRLLATATPLEPKPDAAAPGDAAAERTARTVREATGSGVTLVTGADPELPGRVAAAFPGAVLASPSPAGLRTQAALSRPAFDLRTLSEDSGPLEEAAAVVVADAQLLTLELGVELLELLPDGAHLVLCGDPGTLPATGPGRLFRDLLEIDDPEFGGRIPRVELKARPAGPLTALVDAVRYGGLPPMEILGDGTSNEVKIIPVRDPAETRLRTVQLVTDSIPRAFGLGGGQIQAIALREQGPAGAQDLNAAIKQAANPGPGVCAGLDAGDRVVVREGGRLAEFGLLGGETGTVLAADARGLILRLDQPARALRPDERGPGGGGADDQDVAGDSVDLDARQAGALRHAWVLTLREAQGGRWPAVVAVLDGGSAAALTRAAVLGAFATAERHLSVVHGAGPALAEAVEKRPHTPCRTRLAQALRS